MRSLGRIYSHHQVESGVSDERRFDLTVITRDDHARGCPFCLRAAGADGERAVPPGTHFILKKYKDNSVEFDPADSDKREVMAW